MKTDKLIDAIGLIDDDLVNEVKKEMKPRRSFKKSLILAVAVIMCFVFSFTTLAATVDPFYIMLYRVSPSLAQMLKPVNLKSVSNGIEMEVLSAAVYENEAVIYITVRDIESDRIDQTVDLFDSYRINRPFDSSAYCQRVSFDTETKKATFMIRIDQRGGRAVGGEKITFSVREMLSKKQSFEGELSELKFKSAEAMVGSSAYPGGYRGGSKDREQTIEEFDAQRERELFLTPNNEGLISPVEGIKITGMGYIADELHIQVYYEDIKNFDDHGHISIYDNEGNRVESRSYSFWDSEHKGSYTEFIYEVSKSEAVDCRAEGYFVTCRTNIKGNWQVTFPLENNK